MPFEKGKSGNRNGRPKGVGNKATEQSREAIALFVDNNTPRLQKWLDEIAKESPEKAFNCVKDLIEYHVPKLSRQDVNQQIEGSLTINVDTGINDKPNNKS